MTAYYNEIDPYAAQWLRNLISAGHIAPGDVDERSIMDVKPDDLRNYRQCHFFAGIGVWSYSLRLAGWPDNRQVWTGSCPCQPFSQAGGRKGTSDERHLWPHWFHLISECQPSAVFGEQVASKDGLGWLDLVQADLEGADYACAALDTCSAGVGAPHIRQRLRFFAKRLGNTKRKQRQRGWTGETCNEPAEIERTERLCDVGRLAEPDRDGCAPGRIAATTTRHGDTTNPDGGNGGMEHACSQRRERREASPPRHNDDREAPEWAKGEHGLSEPMSHRLRPETRGPTNGFWRDADWLFCRDGKWRPVEPGTFPLAHGTTNRVGRLRAYGNAIDAEATRVFIEATLETLDERHLCVSDLSDLSKDDDIFS